MGCPIRAYEGWCRRHVDSSIYEVGRRDHGCCSETLGIWGECFASLKICQATFLRSKEKGLCPVPRFVRFGEPVQTRTIPSHLQKDHSNECHPSPYSLPKGARGF